MGALFGSKDPDDVDRQQPPGADDPGEIEQLTGQLGKLGELLAQSNEQIAAYLVRRESQRAASDAAGETSEALGQQIAALAEKVDKLAAAGPLAAAPPAEGPAQGGTGEQGLQAALQRFQEQLDRLEASVHRMSEAVGAASGGDGVTNSAILEAVRQIQIQLDGGLRQLTDLLAPPEEPDEDDAPATSAQWEQAVLGPALAAEPALAFHRQQLLRGVLEGEAGACALAGQLLVFQSAPPERLPQLLKDTGEAFYRWQPKSTPGTNRMEEALAEWLQRSCETAGISNTIELVHPGERFDSARHTATSRGVEITAVRGWIVLRDNGRVYTKAAVDVR
jgi:hypothetical protein